MTTTTIAAAEGSETVPPSSTCARIDVAPLQRHINPDTGALSSSHIRLTRVDNSYDSSSLPRSVEERFMNIEAHLGLDRT